MKTNTAEPPSVAMVRAAMTTNAARTARLRPVGVRSGTTMEGTQTRGTSETPASTRNTARTSPSSSSTPMIGADTTAVSGPTVVMSPVRSSSPKTCE